MKTSKFLILGTLVASLVILAASPVSAKVDVTSLGFRANQGGGGKLSLGWGGGNMGNTWTEGEWVPYQLVLTKVQESWPSLAGMPNIEISYDFTTSGSRFVDLVRGLQVGITQLTDTQGWPQDDGSAYPMTSRADIEDAQKDVGNTGSLENVWSGFTLLNLSNDQVHRDLAGGIGTPTDAVRKFIITPADLTSHGIPDTADTIVIYYQLHESRSFVWSNSLQSVYAASPTDAWGGYVYGIFPFDTDSRTGAGYVPGSSGHVHVLTIGGNQDVPIPIPEALPGAISGMKWEDLDNDGVMDEGEPPLSGWRIYVYGEVDGAVFMTSTLTDVDGLYSFPDLTTGTWRIAEATDREVPAETGYLETYPDSGDSIGVATAVPHSESGQAAWGWDVTLTLEVSAQANVDFGNFMGTPDIHIEKSTNGQDADSPTGPYIAVGSSVTWTYTVTNTGDVPLSNIVVTDDQAGVTPEYQSGDTNTDDILDTTETWIYQATGTAVAGQYANQGTATGDFMSTTVDDTDPSHYFGADIDIHIEKATNGQDADTPTGPVVLVDSLVTWTYTVTNPGNVPLSNVTVTDSVGGVNPTPVDDSPADGYNDGDTNTDNLLDTTETWTYQASGTAVAGQYANIGTATGTPPVGSDVSDTDPSHYFGANPDIHIEKATNGQDADAPTGPIVPVGSLVTWTYTVTNPGNVPLSNITVTDSVGGVTPTAVDVSPADGYNDGDTNMDNLLDTTETWIYEATGLAVAGQYENLGTVTTNEGPTDNDPSHYFGEVVVEYYEDTAYGLNDTLTPICFLDLGFDNWGWIHGPLNLADGWSFEFDLWAGAAHCDTDEGFKVGWVEVDYDGTGVTIIQHIDDPYELISEHVYVGPTPVPHKGNGSSPQETVAPGQYYIEPGLEPGDDIYVIYHAVVQWSDE